MNLMINILALIGFLCLVCMGGLALLVYLSTRNTGLGICDSCGLPAKHQFGSKRFCELCSVEINLTLPRHSRT